MPIKIVRVTWKNSYCIIYFCSELSDLTFFFFWQGMAFKDRYIYQHVLIRNWIPQSWTWVEVREHLFFSTYSLSPQYVLVKIQRPELNWHLNHRKPSFIWQQNDALCLAFRQFQCPFCCQWILSSWLQKSLDNDSKIPSQILMCTSKPSSTASTI